MKSFLNGPIGRFIKVPQTNFTQAVTTTAIPSDISEDPHVPPDINQDSHLVYPLTIQIRGSRGGCWTLYPESSCVGEEWKTQSEEAVKLRGVGGDGRVLGVRMMFGDRAVFEHGQGQGKGELDDSEKGGKVSCSAPFDKIHSLLHSFKLDQRERLDCNGQQLLAVGCTQGIWVGSPDGRFRECHQPITLVARISICVYC
jgi:hypothetical protein